jgi:hypothetical protein
MSKWNVENDFGSVSIEKTDVEKVRILLAKNDAHDIMEILGISKE